MLGRCAHRLVPIVATILLVPIAGPVAAQPAEPTTGDHTSFRFYDRSGYFFTPAGAVRTFTPPTKITGTRYTAQSVGVSVSKSYTEYWGVSFASGSDQPLAVGTYTDTAPFASFGTGSPQVEFSGPGRGCGEVGTFTIHQIEFGADGSLGKFSATFEESCNQRGVPDLFGSVAYHADQPAAPVPHGPPDAPTGISAAGGTDTLILSWTNPPQSFANLVIRRVTTTVPTRDPNVGDLIYTGSGESVQVSALSPNTLYTFTFFARNSEGTYGPPAFLVTRGSNLSIAQAQLTTVPAGSSTVVEAYLQDQDNQLLGGQRVQFWSRKPGTTAWTAVAQADTHDDGYVGFDVTPGTSTEYRFTFAGGQNVTASRSGNIRVTVEPVLSMKAPTTARVGKAFLLKVTMKPALTGEKVKLFERAAGKKPKAVATAKLKKGVATFTVKPKAKGRYEYYVEHPHTHRAGWNTSKISKVKVK